MSQTNNINILEVLKSYDPAKITIGVLGGHSALDVCHGATKMGFNTVVVCQKGREKTFEKYYRRTKQRSIPRMISALLQVFSRRSNYPTKRGCVGHIILVDKFSNIIDESVQAELRELNTIFIHNRYFWTYCDFNQIEQNFNVPIFGLRQGVKLEERDHPNNQYVLLEKAGIRIPKILRKGGEQPADTSESAGLLSNDHYARLEAHFKAQGGPLIVKVNEATRTYERAFFIVNSVHDYDRIAQQKLDSGQISREDLNNAVIEEYILGAHINLNFFYSPLDDSLELMGTDTRRQTNLDGFLRLNAQEQQELLNQGFHPSMVETGHYAVTMKESLIEKAFEIGEKFITTMKEEFPASNSLGSEGIIGPFALQGAVVAENSKEEFVIFDVSMRIPGSPGTKFTPYSGYLYGESLSYGERIALEISQARTTKTLHKIVT